MLNAPVAATKNTESAVELERNFKMPSPNKLFISYPHKPEHCVQHVIMNLKDRLVDSGFDVWLDERIKTGHDWRQEITKGLQESQWVLVFLSAHSTRKDSICLDEMAMAVRYRPNQIVSVLLEPENEIKTPLVLGRIQFLRMEEWESKYKADKGGPAWKSWLQERAEELMEAFERRFNAFQPEELDILREVLDPDQYWDEIAHRLDGFVGREWITNEVVKKLKDTPGPQLLWLYGGPGIGKTCIAAKLAHDLELPAAGVYFCHFDCKRTHSAEKALRTLSYQMASTVPAYRQMLIRQLDLKADSGEEKKEIVKQELSKLTVGELFKKILIDPTYIGGEPHLLIIDGLDEITTEGGDNEIAKLLAGQEFRNMQKWLRVLITSRPDALLKEILSGVESTQINAQSKENLIDLREFLEQQNCLGEGDVRSKAIETLLARSEGTFIYISKAVKALSKGILSPEQPDLFPMDLKELYRKYLERAYPGSKQFKEEARPLLELIIAAPEPLPIDIAISTLETDCYHINDFAAAMGALLNGELLEKERRFLLFHRSFAEWLVQAVAPYSVDASRGGLKLAKALWLDFLERGMLTRGEYIAETLPILLTNLTDYQRRDVLGEPSVAIIERIEKAVERLLEQNMCQHAVQLQQLYISEATIYAGTKSTKVIEGRLGLARIYLMMKRNHMARGEYEILSNIFEVQTRHDDSNKLKVLIGLADCELSDALESRSYENLQKAWRLTENAFVFCCKTFGGKSLEVCDLLIRLSKIESYLGCFHDAILDIKKALYILHKQKGENHIDTIRCLISYASLLHESNKAENRDGTRLVFRRKGLLGKTYDSLTSWLYRDKFDYNAENIYNYLISISENIQINSFDLSGLYNNYACYLIDNQKYDAALIYLKREEEIISDSHNESHPTLGTLYNNMGNVLHALGQFSESLGYCHKALVIRETYFGKESSWVADTAQLLARNYIEIKDFESAEKLLNKAQCIYKLTNDDESEKLVWEDYYNVAQHYQLNGDLKRSKLLFEKILKHRKQHYGFLHISYFGCLMALCNVSRMLGENKREQDYFDEAKKIYVAISNEHPELNGYREIFSNTAKNVTVFSANKTNRNDPCPCGSNKKYKNCCGA